MFRSVVAVRLLLCAFAPFCAQAQQRLPFPGSPASDPVPLAADMAKLARSALAAYDEPDRAKYLDDLFRLQIAAGDFSGATASIESLLHANPTTASGISDRLGPFQLAAMARASQAASRVPFDIAFQRAFRSKLNMLDDKSALRYLYWFVANVESAERTFQATLDRQRGQTEIPLADAITLLRQYVFLSIYRDIQPLTNHLITEDDNRRYLMQDDVLIKTKDGATISVVVVRPRRPSSPLPTAFNFTIYASSSIPDQAKRAAAYGYAGVVGFTRGKRFSPDSPVPYEHDGDDAREVIDWIVKQPWSDGRVGMFGGSYDGFTQWAAAKKPHPALKTIVPYVAAIPGLGLPMENNVFLNANYGWAFYTTNNKFLDDKTYADPQRWSSLDERWFASGRPYRELDSVDGTPNKWLQRWLRHPAFDSYWQSMVPYGQDFARINIPVLTITGYYDDGQVSALQYLKDHYKYNPKAEHYLLIGPWDHFGSQASRKAPVLRGYTVDPVSQVDTPDVTFQWLDYIMRAGKRPELLSDRINYEEMGSNTWKHAPSLDATHSDVLTLYLTSEKQDQYYRLARTKPSKPSFVGQTVDFSDRKSESNDYYPSPVIGKQPDLSTGFAFISEPFDTPISVTGTFAGVLNSRINKKDMDIGIVLYEVLPNGDLFHLSYYLGRASFAKDMTVRHLLTPGKVEAIPFDRTRMVSRRLSKGSRLLVVLSVNKNSSSQLNYGTGKDVSDESITDSAPPLRVQWRNDSYVQIPIWR